MSDEVGRRKEIEVHAKALGQVIAKELPASVGFCRVLGDIAKLAEGVRDRSQKDDP